MDGQQQNFYLDNLNLDSDEMSWDRSGQSSATHNTTQNPTTWNTTPEHDPRALGGRVSAFPDNAFSPSASVEAAPQTMQPEILAPAPAPESLNPAIVTPTIISSEEMKPEITAQPTSAPEVKPHTSAEDFVRNAEVELAQDGNIAGFYDKIRNYGDKE